MIKHQKLSSPSLVRKASLRSNAGSGAAPVVDLDEVLGETTSNSSSRRPVSPMSTNTPDPPPEFANGPSVKSPGSEGSDG